MKRDYKLYLQDIRECIVQLEVYIQGLSEEDFKKDVKSQDAVMRRLEIIGEASRNIPMSLKEKNKEIPWFKLSQFRDLVAHSYFETSLNRVWKIVKEDLPTLKESFQKIKLV